MRGRSPYPELVQLCGEEAQFLESQLTRGPSVGEGWGSKEPLMHLTWGIKEAAGLVEDGGV